MDKFKDYKYSDRELGAIYSREKTTFRLWAPNRKKVGLTLYRDANSLEREYYIMERTKDGVHEKSLEGDYHGFFYNFVVEGEEVTDPYSIGSSVNSRRSAIVDLEKTNPKGWEDHSIPKIKIEDTIIYEMHVKDFTFKLSSGVENRGKYLGFVEKGKKFKDLSTGIDHLKELGISHVHLLPVYDFISVNEKEEYFNKEDNYNWGYDPELYNVPEGSYSSNPEDPVNRILELKTLIMKLHEEGIGVVLDVVYNHTYKSYDSNFNKIVPEYYYRIDENGNFSNGSGCGNELDTEKPMVRRFIIDSLLYWAREYKVDGFRFDLMALIDIDTVEEAIEKLRKLNKHIIIYGEPWAADRTTLNYNKMILKGRQERLGFSLFNDRFRDGLRGDNNGTKKGFIQGEGRYKLDVENGNIGSIHFSNLHRGFASRPVESINYVNSHDDLIIYDKIIKSLPHMAEEDWIRLNKFAFSILFTSQGIPFIVGGNEFLRTKYMVENSYNSPISINGLDWELKEKNKDFYDYFRQLIDLRKENSCFRINNREKIRKDIRFLDFGDLSVIAYTIVMGDKIVLVVHNGEFYSVGIEEKNLAAHLKYCNKSKNLSIRARKIFDLNGYVEKSSLDWTDHESIEVPYYSTSVYEIWLDSRNLFHEMVYKYLDIAKRKKEKVGFLYIAIEGFKDLNLYYGDKATEEIIEKAYGQLNERMRDSDIQMRYCNDEFILILVDLKDYEDHRLAVGRMIEDKYKVELSSGDTVDVKFQYGISFYPRDGEKVEDLIELAHQNMYNRD